MSPPLGKYDCQMVQLYDFCQDQISSKVLLRAKDNDSQEQIIRSAFGDIINQLAIAPKTNK